MHAEAWTANSKYGYYTRVARFYASSDEVVWLQEADVSPVVGECVRPQRMLLA